MALYVGALGENAIQRYATFLSSTLTPILRIFRLPLLTCCLARLNYGIDQFHLGFRAQC